MLTQTLRRLQGWGLVDREAFAQAPPRVEYRLTVLGRTLQEPIGMLTVWERAHSEAIVDSEPRLHPGLPRAGFFRGDAVIAGVVDAPATMV